LEPQLDSAAPPVQGCPVVVTDENFKRGSLKKGQTQGKKVGPPLSKKKTNKKNWGDRGTKKATDRRWKKAAIGLREYSGTMDIECRTPPTKLGTNQNWGDRGMPQVVVA